ncbi:hypothetical protein SAMN05421810_10121 [Amycolatopsis arida]|uniref:DUF6801 domain-containing protein n=1 Tax=Amycolatopsis arida TaxID=587909 RepID=A0A1I5K8E9_9PSEU|nr:DUF6801 domain-containing protein [Amycolatopsis arida]TDX96917.1 hypothetical protein CLV69_10219 [Amycolatopsis arida]SFO80901.1 hypothetical protein SAMN05421810_10121 [Amycolatopsis arida]
MARRIRNLLAGAAAACLATTVTGVLGAGTAQAAEVTYESQTLRYICTYPLIGNDILDVKFQFQAPESVPSGGTVQPHDIVATATVPASVVSLLYYVGGIDGVRGTADGGVTVTNGSPTDVDISDLRIDEQFVSDPDSDFTVIAHQDAGTVVPTITAGEPGTLGADMGSFFAATVDFHYMNTNPPSWQGPESFECDLDTSIPQDTSFTPDMTVTPPATLD